LFTSELTLYPNSVFYILSSDCQVERYDIQIFD